jgi:hypothetical protein
VILTLKVAGWTSPQAIAYPSCRQLNSISLLSLALVGLPDLYDIQFAFTGGGSLGGIADYDIMANPRGQSDRLSWPGHLSAWTRWVLGWVDPIDIVDPGTYELRAVEQFSEVFRISKGYANGEFLLIENRQPIPGDFDERFYAPGGILIYHINENNLELEGYGNSPAGGPYQEGWPENGNHYPIALLQRDGLYELEQRINMGHINDVYIIGSEGLLYPGSGQYPNTTDSYARGNIWSTGIEIDNFRAGSEPGSIRFDVNFQEETQLPTPAPSTTIIQTEKPATEITDSPTGTEITDSPTEMPVSVPTPEAIETEVPIMPTLFPTLGFTPSPTFKPTFNLTTPAPAALPTQKPSITPKPTPQQPTQLPSEIPSRHPVDRPTLPPNLVIIRSGAYTVPTHTTPQGPTSSGSRSSKSSKNSKKSSKSSKGSKAKGSKGKGSKGKGKGNRPVSNFSNSKKRLQRFSTEGLKETLGIWDDSTSSEDKAQS